MVPFYTFIPCSGTSGRGLDLGGGDMRARGFLMGHGRRHLLGEGSSTTTASRTCCLGRANVQAYDPAFAYETATIVRDGIRRMYGEGGGEDISTT